MRLDFDGPNHSTLDVVPARRDRVEGAFLGAAKIL
jgi:hypothetical protein